MSQTKTKTSVLPALYKTLEKHLEFIEDLRAKHAKLFRDYDAIESARVQTETQIKKILHERYLDHVDGTYTDYAGDRFSVLVTTATERAIDVERLLAKYPAWRKLDGLVLTTLDRKVLEKLIAQEEIDKKQVDPFVTETPRTPAVKITPVVKPPGKTS